jgi:cell division protein ZapA
MNNKETDAPTSEAIRVNIFDQTYSLRSPSGGEHVKQIAQLVDERMRQISAHGATFDLARIAVLAALNIADELQSLKAQYEQEIQEAARSPQSSSEESEAAEAEETPAEDEPPYSAPENRQSWFEAIFDADVPVKSRSERLSSQVSAKLKSRRQEESEPHTSAPEEND